VPTRGPVSGRDDSPKLCGNTVKERGTSVEANSRRAYAGGGEGEGSVKACGNLRDAADLY
jgi:hypothetical protein